MTKVSILYPRAEGSTFDMDYYLTKHIPMCARLFGPALRKAEVDEGVGGGLPGSSSPFVAAVHLYFDSVDAFYAAFGPHAAEILGDVPKYTNIKPVTQISKVR